MPRLVLFAENRAFAKGELRHLPAFGQIGLLPRHILGVLAEVAVAGNLAEPRAAQVKALDDRGRAHIHGGDERLNLFAVNLLRAEGIDQHGNRLRHADGIGELNLAAVGQTGGHDVLGEVARHVGRAAIHLAGILAGVFFLKKGYTLKRSYKMQPVEGGIFPVVEIGILLLLIAAPAFIHFTEANGGPGAKHAAIAISLIAGILVGAMAQRTRLCMVGGIRDVVLFGEWKLLLGFIAILISALIGNMILGYFNPGFAGQPVAHTDGLWNALGMALAGFGCVLLGGCPLRQLVLAGEGNTDSAITVFGLMAGAAVAHNFGLASSGEGPTANGKVAVVIGFVVLFVIAVVNSMRKSEA